jgi:predicted methyltransferase
MRRHLLLALVAGIAVAVLPPAESLGRDRAKAAAARRAVVAAAIGDPRRLPGDREQDGWRRPDVVLDFAGVTPTMKTIDFIAGGGYYSELLARIVGPQGRVVAYNTPRTREFVSAEISERYAGDRLPNVESLIASLDDLYLSMDSADVALLIDVYHDLYTPGPDGRPIQDPRRVAALIARALRKGGVLVVQDHVAAPGGDASAIAASLHRIDPAIVRSDFEAVGLKFEAESDALRNPADDHGQKVFEPGIRHRTDRILYRFRKPAK